VRTRITQGNGGMRQRTETDKRQQSKIQLSVQSYSHNATTLKVKRNVPLRKAYK